MMSPRSKRELSATLATWSIAQDLRDGGSCAVHGYPSHPLPLQQPGGQLGRSLPLLCHAAVWAYGEDEELDHQLIRAMQEKDIAALASLPRKRMNSGTSEMRNWIAAAGAVEHLQIRIRLPGMTGIGPHKNLAGEDGS